MSEREDETRIEETRTMDDQEPAESERSGRSEDDEADEDGGNGEE